MTAKTEETAAWPMDPTDPPRLCIYKHQCLQWHWHFAAETLMYSSLAGHIAGALW